MTRASHRQTVVIGLFVLVGALLLAGAILMVGQLRDTFGRKVVVHTGFEDVRGLGVGANVWFAGVKVGAVRDVRLVGPARVEVDLAIDRAATAHIPGDSLARISTDALLGNKIVVLYGGSAEGGLAPDTVLAPGPVVSTDDMLAMLQQNNQNLLAVTSQLKWITADLAEGRGTAGRLLTDDSLYVELRDGIDTFAAASTSARRLADELGTFAGKMNQPDSLPNDLVTDEETWALMTETARNLAAVSARAESLAGTLDRAGKDPTTPLGTLLQDPAAAENLQQTLENLDRGSRLLAEDLEALQHNFLLRRWFKKREREAPEAGETP